MRKSNVCIEKDNSVNMLISQCSGMHFYCIKSSNAVHIHFI